MKSKLFTKKILIPIFISLSVLLGACITARTVIVKPRLIQDAHDEEYEAKNSPDGLYMIGFEDNKDGNKFAALYSFMGGYYYNLEVSDVSPYYFDCLLKKVSNEAYSKCIGLKKVILPQTVEEIQKKAFIDCTDLKEIYIPSSVTKISEKAFVRTSKFKMYVEKGSYAEKYAKENKITCKYYTPKPVSKNKKNYPELANSKAYKEFRYTTYYYNNKTECSVVGCNPMIDDGDVVVPNEINGMKVKSIASEGFQFCENAVTVKLPDSVTSVGSYAFLLCSSLEKVYFTENVKTIGLDIFEEAPNAVICAPENSYAHKYAVKNNIKFEPTS